MSSKYSTDYKIKEQIDKYLHQMAIRFANTGKDSTFGEMRDAYRDEDELINEIEKVDPSFAKIIRPYTNE